MLTDKKISIVVVCYNDGGSVEEMHRRVTEVMKNITPHWELIYANDASPDNALEVLREVAKRDKHLIVLNHARNFGSQVAYTSGMRYATGDAVILLDGDLQDPPELFPEFVKKWLAGYDIAYGERKDRKASLPMRIFYKAFYRIFRKLSYINIPLDAGDFSLISRRALDVINDFPEVDRYIRGLRAYVGFKSVGIPYVRDERYSGVSGNSLLGNFKWAKRMIVAFSYKPLELISYVAAIVTVLAGIAIVAYTVMYFFFSAPQGFLTTLAFTLFLGAVQLLCLSVIAEYLAKIYEEVKHRPIGIVSEIINDYKKK